MFQENKSFGASYHFHSSSDVREVVSRTDRNSDRDRDKEVIGTDVETDTDRDREGIGTWTRTGQGKDRDMDMDRDEDSKEHLAVKKYIISSYSNAKICRKLRKSSSQVVDLKLRT